MGVGEAQRFKDFVKVHASLLCNFSLSFNYPPVDVNNFLFFFNLFLFGRTVWHAGS